MAQSNKSNFVVYLSTYPPRECGIATFTDDLTTALDKRFNPATKSRIVAINENPTSIYNYGPKTLHQITASNLEQYVALAEKINDDPNIKVVNIQHEFGIFGGEWGDYLMPFLQVVKKPVVTTFHSVLAQPSDFLKRLVRFIGEKSQAVVVMNQLSKNVLESQYSVSPHKIILIPHGIPETTFESSEKAKATLKLSERTVISTFGLFSRDKGIEYAIRALPTVIKQHPNVIYLVLGATHPVVRRHEGEKYRNFLMREVDRLGLKNHVKFYNKYLTIDEIIQFLKATDVYVSPTLNPRQSVSGTLSYAMGCGRPVVATASEYARHLVTPETGFTVKFRNANAIARALLLILEDDKKMRAMSQAAYETTRKMIWPNVARDYFGLYQKFAEIDSEERKLPEAKLDHIIRLTDTFGILHHARYSKPERSFGYSLDDNARALIVAAKSYKVNPKPEIANLLSTYLKFIKFVSRPGGTFANVVSASKERDNTRDEDVQGRALWALGYVASADFLPENIRREANSLFKRSLKAVGSIQSPRAIAFAMTGLYHSLTHTPNTAYLKLFNKLAETQLALFKNSSSPDWQWFEDSLTYSNSKLPESLFYAYALTKRPEFLRTAQASLKFLTSVTFEPDYYSPIGQNGWYFRYRKRAYYDQQPEDAASMVETKTIAYKITGDRTHLDDAFKAFQWFLGRNHLGQVVYNEVTGGCSDGVGKTAINLNQGAESTLSYLLARLALEEQNLDQIAIA